MDDAARFEQCFEHQAWVRALATRLCADASDAEDVEQDTWYEVARGGAVPRSVRCWLGGIVRHLARRQHRRGTARARRERLGARPEAVPSSDVLLAQAELQRRVLAAVAELDEAHRVVVLMHHYEGHDGAEIARRLGLPGSTVRSRLARAHAKLRARMNREYGGERAAWAGLLGSAIAVDSGAPAALLGAGVAMKIQLAVVGALAVALTVVLWPERTAERRSPTPALVPPSSAQAAHAFTESAATGPGPEAEPVAARTAAAPGAGPLERVLVFGDLLGLEGPEPPGGEITFVDANGVARSATPGARGTYSIFGLEPGVLRVKAWVRGCAPLDDEITIPAGQPKVRHDIRLERGLVLPVRFLDRATGEPIDATGPTLRCALAAVATSDLPLRVEGVFGRAPRATDAGSWSESRMSLRGGPRSGMLEVWQQPPVYVSCVLREAVLQSRLLHGDETELVFELDRAEIERALATLALRCVDARSGEAIEPRSVVADVESGGCPGNRAQSDGVTTISGLAPGWRSLEVRAEGYGDYERWVHLAPGARVDLGTIELMPAARLRGRVVDAGGEGVRARITAYSLRTAGSPRDHLDPGPSRETAEDGAFELAGLESDRLRVVARGTDLAWTALDVDARGGDVEGLELRLERGTEVWLSPVRGARTAVQALLLDASGGVLCAFRLHPAGAGWTLRLAPGSYELALVRDNAVVGRQGFQVGAERVVVEVAQP